MDELQQELKNRHIEAREAYPVHNLHWTWHETEPAVESDLLGRKTYALGSKNYTKMIQFAAEVELRNLDVDYWMSIKPQRMEGEPSDDFKVRSRFQQALLKYRPYIYNYSNITSKFLKRARKQNRKQTIAGSNL